MNAKEQEPRWPGWAAAASALLLFGLIFGPSVGALGERFLGAERVDAYGTHWFYWFVGREMAAGSGFGHTDLYFFPFGKDIYSHTGANVLDAIVAQPFYAALGPVSGYNVFCLFAILINGLAALPLMAQFSESRAARFFGATFYALNPFLLFELKEGRPTQVFQPFLPLFFYHLLRFESAGWKHALWGALHLALTAFTYWFYAIFAGMVAVVHFAQRAVLHPDPRRFFGRHAVAGLVSLAFVTPAALPLILSTMASDTPGLLVEPRWPFLTLETLTIEGVDIGLNTFQPVLRASGFLVDRPDGSATFSPNAIVLTLTQVALVGLGLALSRHRWVLGAMLGAALTLSVGHLVWLGDGAIPNPLYVLAVKIVPFMRRLWWPGRALALAALLIGVLAAAGLGEIARRRGAVAGFLAGMLALASFGVELSRDGYLPYPTWNAAIPPGYQCLAKGEPGAIIELPYARSQSHLYYQTAHGRPMLGGMVEDNPVFTPAEQRALLEENSFLRLLIALGRSPRSPGTYTAEDAEAVRALGYRYVVVQHRLYMSASSARTSVDTSIGEHSGALLRRLADLLGRPVYVDPDVTVFAPWGDPSPCGEEGPGRDAWPMYTPEDEDRALDRITVRPPRD